MPSQSLIPNCPVCDAGYTRTCRKVLVKREGAKRRAIDEILLGWLSMMGFQRQDPSRPAPASAIRQQKKHVGNVTLPLPKSSNTRVSMTCHNIIGVAVQPSRYVMDLCAKQPSTNGFCQGTPLHFPFFMGYRPIACAKVT